MPVFSSGLLNHILYKEGYLEKLIADNYEDIYRYCCYHLGQRQTAEDITQEVFLKFLNNLDSYKWKLVSETATVKQYPQEEIDRYLQDNTAYYQKIAEQYGMAFADYLSAYGMTEEAFQELLQKDAEAYVRDCFVAEKIARDQDISFTEEEYKEMLEDLVMAAILDGYKKADAVYQEKMSRFAGAAGGMGGLF